MTKFVAIVMIVFGALAIVAVVVAIAFLIAGQPIAAIIGLIAAVVFYLMSRSLSRTLKDLRA